MAVASLLFLSGCTSLHKVDENPQPSVLPVTYPSGTTQSSRVAGNFWWKQFEDPTLDQLMIAALKENLTVAAFTARIRASQALARQAGALSRPQLEGSANTGLIEEDAPGLAETLDDLDSQTNVGLLASWEIDLFGRLASRRAAALSELDAASADLDAIRLSLTAQVATEYYRAVEQMQLLILLEAQVESDEAFLELTELRFRMGVTDRVDVLRQQALLAETRSLLPLARASLREAENRLDVLLGLSADGMNRVNSDFPALIDMQLVGIPADLLLHRPDLKALQARLEAIDFQTAEAIADRLPRFELSANLNYRTGDAGTNVATSLLAGLFAPLLDGGRRSAFVEQRRAEYDAALAEYEESFLIAVSEVENLLYRAVQQDERVSNLSERESLLREALLQSRDRYENGLIDFLAVLTALENLQETERELIAARREQIQLRVDLQRAIGGNLP